MKYRIGKKQKRALLDETGHLVAMFEKGHEGLAQTVCNRLNQEGLVEFIKAQHEPDLDLDEDKIKALLNYKCQLCHDTGYITTHTFGGESVTNKRCNCKNK